MKSLQTQEFYDFGTFRLDVRNRLLLTAVENKPVALTLKEFEILLFLVKNSGQVIKKEDLLETIWKDTFVEEGTLTRNISRLRKKLGEANENDEQYIETLPKRGYRFLPIVVKIDSAPVIIEEKLQLRLRVEEIISTDAESETIDAELKSAAPHKLTEVYKPEAKNQVRRYKLLAFSFGALLITAIGFVIYQTYSRASEKKTIVANRVIPFSGATGRENMPSFSPDGKQIAFAWSGNEGGDKFNIYIRLVDATQPIRLTENDFNDQYPTFSPNGSQIAFVRSLPDHGEVILISALGGTERRIARLFSGNFSISFSPDGRLIAAVDTENSVKSGQYAVYVIDIQTGERRRLTVPAEFAGETTPRFSPDGKSLAFVRVFSDRNQDLFVVPVTGGEPRRLTFDETIINSLAWSADGKNIFYVSFRGGNQTNIWRVAAANGGEPELVAAKANDVTNIAASPNGKTLAFVENSRKTNVWRISSKETAPKKFLSSIYSESNADVSPDNSRVVFVSNRTGKNELWIADIDGGNLRQLNDSLFSVNAPHFSPDGSQIVYQDITNTSSDIFIIASEGGGARRLTVESSRNTLPAWSADGRFIYFTSNRTGEDQLWKISSEGGEAVQITLHGALRAMAAPDGKTIFYSKTANPGELWKIPTEGGTEEKLPEFSAQKFAGAWTVTPTGIYFLAQNSDNYVTLKYYDFARRNFTEKFEGYKIPNNIFSNIGATTDGSIIFYSLFDRNTSSIMFAELEND